MIRWSVQIAILVLLLSLGFNAGLIARHQGKATEPEDAAEPEREASFKDPDPGLDPREVVKIQVANLADCQVKPDALQQVYAFASPDNREVTGPIDRFATMLLSPQYKPLVEQRQVIVGSQVVHGDLATVMVTAMDREHRLRTFHFYLAREAAGTYADCWMTYGVIADPALDPATPATTGI